MNYEMIGAIIVCGVTIMAFIKPILDLKAVLTRIDETLKNLQKIMDDDKITNKKDHDTFFKFIREASDRITVIETEHRGNHD